MRKLFFLFFILTLGSFAQVPGYMGKRFSIGYSNYFSPRLPIVDEFVQLQSSYGGTIAMDRPFNSTHSIDLDYAIGKKVSLCVSGQFSKMDLSRYGSVFEGIQYANSNPYSLYGGDLTYLPADKKNMELTTTNISLGFKFFKKGYINPFGRYRKLELILLTDEVTLDQEGFYRLEDNSLYAVQVDGIFKYKSFAFAYTMGKQRIFFNKLILDWGLRVGINYSYVFNGRDGLGGVFSGGNGYAETMDERIKYEVNVRVLESQILNAHIGLRFLAF